MQYLFNASVIWLVSLMAFELFFRRETVHWLNRAYLLGTLVLGLLLPLWEWQRDGIITNDIVRTQVVRAAEVRERMVPAVALHPNAPAHATNWLLILYVLGTIVSLVFTLGGAVMCISLYRKGSKTKQHGYTLVQTGNAHGPFSFFSLVFISGTSDYTAGELQLVLQHELRHAKQLHSIDVLVLQVLKTVLWFHPLVYWYDRRLRMVHEYEADAVGKENTNVYGQFLIEQALLQHAPVITHSFHHSPVKTRIIMLMRNRTTRVRMTKYLLALPMIAFFSIACTQDILAQQAVKKGNHVYFKENDLELNTVADPAVVEFLKKHPNPGESAVDSFPVKLNGEKIYEPKELSSRPVYDGPDGSAAEYLVSQLGDLLGQLHDGNYQLIFGSLILDAKGNLAYYGYQHINPSFLKVNSTPKKEEPASTFIEHADSAPYPVVINEKLGAAAMKLFAGGQIHYKPATVGGMPVATYLDEDLDFLGVHLIQVRNHKARVLPGNRDAVAYRYNH